MNSIKTYTTVALDFNDSDPTGLLCSPTDPDNRRSYRPHCKARPRGWALLCALFKAISRKVLSLLDSFWYLLFCQRQLGTFSCLRQRDMLPHKNYMEKPECMKSWGSAQGRSLKLAPYPLAWSVRKRWVQKVCPGPALPPPPSALCSTLFMLHLLAVSDSALLLSLACEFFLWPLLSQLDLLFSLDIACPVPRTLSSPSWSQDSVISPGRPDPVTA